jgi:hypothetical protein
MSFFKRLGDFFSGAQRTDENSFRFTVQCKRCGEKIEGRVDMRNDLSQQYEEDGDKTTYFTRKVLMGSGSLCFQRIEVELTFDENRKLVDRQIQGGTFVEEE